MSRWRGLLLGLLAALGSVGAAGAQPELSDLAGLWVPVDPMAPAPEDFVRALRPDPAARYRQAVETGKRPEEDYGYCTPPSFSGGYPPSRVHDYFEMFVSPGRVTLINGQGLVRRFHLRDTPVPDALEESRAGTSIASWDGRTLVVHTTRMYSRAKPLVTIVLGRNASTVERFTLTGPDTLEVTTTLTAPEIFLSPAVRTAVYRRDRGAVPLELDMCVDDDASVDHATGEERFDTTPPDDLPPPPGG
jgi:hypothetical protein